MLKKIKKYLSIGYVYFCFANVTNVYAGGMAPATKPPNLPEEENFSEQLIMVLDFFIGLVGLIAFLMLVIGGLRYIMSGGNDDSVQKAKHTILYAVIGIIVVVISYAAVHSLTSGITGE